MINLSEKDPVWLMDATNVKREFIKAVGMVRSSYSAAGGGTSSGSDIFGKIRKIFDNENIDLKSWGIREIEGALGSTFRGADTNIYDVDPDFRSVPKGYYDAFNGFLKLVFIVMWGRKAFLAPLGFQAPLHNSAVIDDICRKLNIETLLAIRTVHPESALEGDFKRAEVNNDSSRTTFWQRLLISTTFYSIDDVNEEECQKLIDNAFGDGIRLLRRYYVPNFLLVLVAGRLDKRAIVERVISRYQSSKESAKVSRKEQRLKSPRVPKSPIASAVSNSISVILDFSNGEIGVDIDELFGSHMISQRVKRIFGVNSKSGQRSIYDDVQPVVRKFCLEIDGLFRTYLQSKRLHADGNYIFVLNLFLSYLCCYLPAYYLQRDNSLEEYPEGLEDFNCSIFFTREHIFSEGYLKFSKEPPMTFLTYMGKYAKVYGWVNDTLYARVLVLDGFCGFVQEHRDVLPGLKDFSNNFTSSCYSPIQKKIGTVKKNHPEGIFRDFPKYSLCFGMFGHAYKHDGGR